MEIAESLYQRGYISYPRTETDSFKEGTDLENLIRIQINDQRWGAYAQQLVDARFLYPRNGGHDDGAHPPIHPTRTPDGLANSDDLRVYEFITRHFLACCSHDGQWDTAIGAQRERCIVVCTCEH
jgi:DNA topoisomerase-3